MGTFSGTCYRSGGAWGLCGKRLLSRTRPITPSLKGVSGKEQGMCPCRSLRTFTSRTGRYKVFFAYLTGNVCIISSVQHRCRNNFKMKIRAYDEGGRTVCDGNVTDHNGDFWRVVEVLDQDQFLCQRVLTELFTTNDVLGPATDLPWSRIGVRREV